MNKNKGIYLYTNLINGKQYVGQSTDLQHRKNAHKSCAFNPNSNDYNSMLHRAFRKYGLENFKYEILVEGIDDISILNILEEYYIKLFNTKTPNGYNVLDGGNNSSRPKDKEWRKKLIWGQAKLTEAEVIYLRKAYANKESPTKIYNEFFSDRLHFNSFLNIWCGKRYSLIMPEVFNETKRHTKLTEETVKKIRQDREELSLTYQQLGEKYGISKSTIADIVRKRTWKNV